MATVKRTATVGGYFLELGSKEIEKLELLRRNVDCFSMKLAFFEFSYNVTKIIIYNNALSSRKIILKFANILSRIK